MFFLSLSLNNVSLERIPSSHLLVLLHIQNAKNKTQSKTKKRAKRNPPTQKPKNRHLKTKGYLPHPCPALTSNALLVLVLCVTSPSVTYFFTILPVAVPFPPPEGAVVLLVLACALVLALL
jgi:hypothetical protein